MGYVDTTGYLLGQQEARLEASNTPEHTDSLDQDAFLELLVAQLTNQDPLNPVEDTDMTAQLAQFSSLEQLTSINSGIEALTESLQQSELYSAVQFIGKSVKAEGYNITKDGDYVSTIYYGFGETVSEITLNIYDSEGDIVRTEELGSKQEGSYEYVWDGLDDDGNELADGVYSVGILGTDVDGDSVLVSTEISGVVSGVVNESGTNYLHLKDGRYLNFLNVIEVVDVSSTEDATETDGSDTTEADSSEE